MGPLAFEMDFKKDKQQLYVMDRKQLQDDRVLHTDPQTFFLPYHRLGEKLCRLREKVVSAFREIDYKRLTPLITKVFGSTDFIGIEDSGINELFKPPRRGRPPRKDAKKRQRQDFDVEYQATTTSSHRNLRRKGLRKRVPAKAPPLDASSSDTNKVLNIADILLQATDLRTGQVKVFVEWDDRPLSAASWIRLNSLNNDAAQWWNLLKEVRYPNFPENMFPKLPISGSPEHRFPIWTRRRSPSHPLIRQLGPMRRSMRLDFVF